MHMRQLSTIAQAIPDFHVLRIDRIANDLIKNGIDVIKLNLGKSEVPMREIVADEMARKIYDGVRREIVDAQGISALREAIAMDYHDTYGVSVNPDTVFINNGTSPFFLMLYQLLLDPGEEVLLPLPYYPPYFANTVIARVTAAFYSIRDGRIDLDEFERNFKPGKTKLVILNSPGNPFGNVVSQREIERVLQIVDGRAAVISDEIYDGLVYDGGFCPTLGVARAGKDLVIVLNGFSKIHHMYTRRLGYAIVPPMLREPMLRFQRHNIVCVDPVTQFAGIVSLKTKRELLEGEVKQEIALYKNRLEVSKGVLRDTALKVIEPAGSFYVPVDVSAYVPRVFKSSLDMAQALLEKAHIAVTPGEDFGRNDFFRIGLTSDRITVGMERMRDFVRGL